MKEKNLLAGIVYGLAPHTFCILFVVLSIIGVTAATTLLRPFLLNAYFFYFLILLSFIFATISSVFYLKRNGILSRKGVIRKWKYLTIMYGTTIFINLFLFLIIFPITANFSSASNKAIAGSSASTLMVTLRVEIPCSGHAGLITNDLKTINGVENIKFRFPNYFDVSFNSDKTNIDEILNLEVFKTYKATVVK